MIQGVIAGAVFAAMLWLFDLPLAAGAHPFWAAKVIWIGAPIGLLAFVISKFLSPIQQILISVVLAALALVAAVQGKAIFAASFAENALAGQAWFFGWIATCAALTALVASIARMMSAR